MKRSFLSMLFMFVASLIGSNSSMAQCGWSGWSGYNYPGIPCNSFSGTYPVGSGTYTYFTAYAGVTYTVSTCGSSFDTQISIYDANPAWTARAYNDDNGPDCAGLQGSVTFTASFTGDHIAIVNRYNCAQHDFTGVSAVLKFRKNPTPCTTQTASTWNGSASADWFDNCNWSNCVPGTITNALVPVVATYPIINSPAVVNTITVNAGGPTVTINSTLTPTQ
jgi:hypothetical protein